jgi:DNA-binding CsgD family transcriptional regulator
VLRGDLEAATRRQQQINAIGHIGNIEHARETLQLSAGLALWAGRPADALREVRRALALFTAPDLTILFGWLRAAGMRACADLAEQARARRDDYAVRDALGAADGLASWVEQMEGAPFTDHPFVAAIPAERATWDAERTRVAGASDPAAWRAAAKTWEDLGWPHRAGYAWWRRAEAQLAAGQPAAAAAAALRAAAAAADGHAPLLAEVRKLAERARIPLRAPAAVIAQAPSSAQARLPFGLTGRELAVLRLVAAGHSNTQIGTELFISRATVSVHVTSILRKLGVTNRVQAAALAERAGLLDTRP